MNSFELCDIVIVTAEHPIGLGSRTTKGEIGMITEVCDYRGVRCYKVQNASRNRQVGIFYAADELRKATGKEIVEEFQRLMLGN